MFTADPITGQRDQIVINAAWGLGEAIVSGRVTPDTLTVDKATGRILKRETADKQVMTVLVEHHTEERPVPEDRRHALVLSDVEADELAQWGVRIEQFYGRPMDIEWARAGAFAIVQLTDHGTANPTARSDELAAPKVAGCHALIVSKRTPLFALAGSIVHHCQPGAFHAVHGSPA
jgi:pyruvate,water dikinase